MDIQSFTATRQEGLAKWREYKNAEKSNDNPIYKDLRIIYNQMKAGRKIIDIGKVIAKGGVHENHHPKLAVAMASAKRIVCKYNKNGNVLYTHSVETWNWKEKTCDVNIKDCLPKIPNGIIKDSWQDVLRLEAPVPMIPPKYLPKKLSDDYYILWEVDEWKMVPPTDPWLLRRITKTHFLLVAGWDLTDLEKSVMAGRMF